ncbi:MAG: BatD family protein [Bacteroidota bacterium]
MQGTYAVRNTKYEMHNTRHLVLCTRSVLSYFSLILSCIFLFPYLGFAQPSPKVSSKVDTTFIKIGEQIRFTVTVEADTTAQVIFPEGQTFSPLETVEAMKTDTAQKNGRYALQKIYALTQFDSGSYKLPAQRIEINGKGYFTDSLRIEVATVPVDTLAQKLYDIKDLMAVEKSHARLWRILLWIFLGLIIVGGLFYWFVFRKKPLTEAEKEALLPPYDRALLELKRLENSRYLIQDEYKQYYSELTNIVRSYLEEDVNVSALESTTDELITKLEMLKDAGELELDRETLTQFKQILQTADLVKFARSKPPTSTAEQDRKSIEHIVIKTHEALPEPTEEELMQQAEYQEELARKQQRKKWILAASIAAGALAFTITALAFYHGPGRVWDTVTFHPSKRLLEREWISSMYGSPPINLETPEVLIRQKVKIPPEAKDQVKELQTFGYRNADALFTVAVTSTTFTQPAEPEFEKTIEQLLKTFENNGAKNIITKQEEFTTISGVTGIKTYGSGKFKIPESDELIKGKYAILSFGGQGFQQQVLITWVDDDTYAQEIVDRILKTLEVKTEV